MSMVERFCKNCRAAFQAKSADVKRGWAKYCSKSCKAKHQERKTGATSAFYHRQDERDVRELEGPTFSNAHQFSNEEHDCNKGLK